MKSYLTIGFLLLLFIISACKDMGKNAQIIMKNIGVGDSLSVNVNGVSLKHPGTVSLKVSFDDKMLNISEGSADIILTGNEMKESAIMISYFEFKPKDATIYIENSTIKAKSISGKPVLINRIEGTIPMNLKLDIETGSGDITLIAMQGNESVKTSTGSGDITITQAKQWGDGIAKTGSGDVSVEILQANSIYAETGSGNVEILKSKIIKLNATTGSGNITMTGSQVEDMQADTGSGDIMLKDSKVNKRHFSQGSGDIFED